MSKWDYKCAVCEGDFLMGDKTVVSFGSEDVRTRYPVCRVCHESGKHEVWREKAIAELRAATVSFVSEGNLAEDYRELLSWQKHDERLSDGVCPNGCARMVKIDRCNSECPVCHFGYYCNSGVK